MATQQVFDWIQNDLRLSKAISNFETDFASGYLLGEILVNYGVLEDMNVFSKKNNKEAKVNNFYLVEEALRRLKIRFDAKLVHNIMQEERGAALRLLYQIKLACERFSRVELPDDPSMQSMTNLRNGRMHTILKSKQQQILELSQSIPPPTVSGKDVRTNNKKMMDARTVSFDVAKKLLIDKTRADEATSQQEKYERQQEERASNRAKLAENQQFMKDWDEEGHNKWRTNQIKRTEGISKVKYFEDREVGIWRDKLQNEFLSATGEAQDGVQEFEKNLQKLGIEQHINMDEAIKRQEEKRGIPPGQIQNFSYAATMNKIKETKKNSDFAGKERERRRRKMQVDQITAQEKLDAEKSEAALIEKLLSRTRNAQEEAYKDRRTLACKQVLFDRRKGHADKFEQKRAEQNAVSEARKLEENKVIEVQRRGEDSVRRKECTLRNREKIQQKRGVNVEIASGLVDLLVDLTDETFEQMEQSDKQQIPRAVWREFMQLFKDGQKVSLRNIRAATLVQDDALQESSQLSQLAPAYSLLKEHSRDPVQHLLLDFLCQAGQFQFAAIDQVKWNQFEHLLGRNAESLLRGSISPNQQLADEFNRLMGPKTEAVETPESGIPQNLTFKIAILGRAFAGKKTVAKQLADKLGNAIKVFQIDRVISEAIEYVSPKTHREEAPDPKAKGKKVVEAAPTDPFDGKDTEMYRKLAEQLKARFFGGSEGVFLGRDLAEKVNDDQLLCDLVLERLALEYQGDANGLPDLLAGVKREKEIIEQLEELEAAAAGTLVDTKAKGKPVKGGPDPEKLRSELEEIKRFKATGFILVDFPRTLSQAKVFEEKLSGYRCKLDIPKSLEQEQVETWQKMITPAHLPFSPEREGAINSSFDGWLVMDIPSDQCNSRAVGRKLDPLTNTVYHPDSNPAPEDPKLQDRLQEYSDEAGQSSRLSTNHSVFDRRLDSLLKWCHQFGLTSQGKCQVPLDLVYTAGADVASKDQVFQQVMERLNGLVGYKQREFDAMRAAFVSEYEAQQALESAYASEGKVDSGEREDVGELSEMKKPTVHKSKASDDLGGCPSSSHAESTVRSSLKKRAQQRVYEINESQRCQKLEEVTDHYFREALTTFGLLQTQRSRIFELLNDTQAKFLNYLAEPGSLQQRVVEFCDSYNRFCQEYPDLRQQEETRQELQSRVNILSNQLWTLILERKDLALSERANLMKNGWASAEKIKLIQHTAKLFEQEYQKLNGCVSVATGFVLNEELDLAGLCKKLVERDVAVYEQSDSDDGTGQSPVLEQLLGYLLNAVGVLYQESFVHQAPANVNEGVTTERVNFNVRINSLRLSCLFALEEISHYCGQVFDKLDDWVVDAVKRDNQACQRIVKQLRRDVDSGVSYMEYPDVGSAKIRTLIQKIDFCEGPPRYMSVPISNRSAYDQRFDLGHIEELYLQFKQFGTWELLDTQTFLSLMVQNYQARRVPQRWIEQSFRPVFRLVDCFTAAAPTNDTAQPSSDNGYGSIDSLVNWKQILTLMTLAGSYCATEEQLCQYEERLKEKSSDGALSLDKFLEVDAWFDRTERAMTASQLIKAVATNDEESDEEFEDDDAAEAGVFGSVGPSKASTESLNLRLQAVKAILWRAYKRNNESGLQVGEIMHNLRQLGSICREFNLYGELLA